MLKAAWKKFTSIVNDFVDGMNAYEIINEIMDEYPYLKKVFTDSIQAPKFDEYYFKLFSKNLAALWLFLSKERKSYDIPQSKLKNLLRYLPEIKNVEFESKPEFTRYAVYLENNFELNENKLGLFLNNLKKFREKIAQIDDFFKENDFILKSLSNYSILASFIGKLQDLKLDNDIKIELIKFSLHLNYFVYSVLCLRFKFWKLEFHMEDVDVFISFINFLPEFTDQIKLLNLKLENYILKKNLQILFLGKNSFNFWISDIESLNIDLHWFENKVTNWVITNNWELSYIKFYYENEQAINKYSINFLSLQIDQLSKLEYVLGLHISSKDKQLIIDKQLYFYPDWEQKYVFFEKLQQLFPENWDIYFEKLNKEKIELLISYPKLKEIIFEKTVDDLQNIVLEKQNSERLQLLKSILPDIYQNEGLDILEKIYKEKIKSLSDILNEKQIKELFEVFYLKKTKKNWLVPKIIWDILWEIKKNYERHNDIDLEKFVEFLSHQNVIITKGFLNQYNEVLNILLKKDNLNLALELIKTWQFSLVNTVTYLNSQKAKTIIKEKLDWLFKNLSDIGLLIESLGFEKQKLLLTFSKLFNDSYFGEEFSDFWFDVLAILEKSTQEFKWLIEFATFLKKIGILEHFSEFFNISYDTSLFEKIINKYKDYEKLNLSEGEIIEWISNYLSIKTNESLNLFDPLLIETDSKEVFKKNKGLDGLWGWNWKEIIRQLEKLGCRVKTIYWRGKIQWKWDHKLVLAPDGKSLSAVPMHNSVKASTLFDILNRLKIKKEDFINA